MQVSEPDQAYLFVEIWLCVKIKDPPRFLGSFGKVSQPHGVFSPLIRQFTETRGMFNAAPRARAVLVKDWPFMGAHPN